jgi:hypothetical protein
VILKVSKSGNGIVVVDDFGNTYATSKQYLLSLVSGRMKAPFILLTRMPVPAQVDRFKPSPVMGKGGEHVEVGDERWVAPQCLHNVVVDSEGGAGMARKQSKKREVKKHYEDKVVW